MTLRKAFDGEVYYWYEDDPVARREMSRVDPLRFVNAKIYTQADLDQARKEARAAAFKEALSAINAVPMSRYWSDSGEEIARSFRAQVIRRIEAAANDEEGGGDG